jgi:signal peptidase I
MSRSAKIVREIVETIILTVLIFLVVRLAVQNFRVDGTSMLPTVKNGELVLVNKVDYLVGSPARGDVVVFHFPLNPSQDFIKRVIATPGDTVRIRAGQGVWVDDKKLSEPYIAAIPNYNYPITGGPAKVPKDDYFVLGDNRNDSYDSHAWGFVPRHNIIGKALVAYWPILTNCHWKGILPSCSSDLKFFSF